MGKAAIIRTNWMSFRLRNACFTQKKKSIQPLFPMTKGNSIVRRLHSIRDASIVAHWLWFQTCFCLTFKIHFFDFNLFLLIQCNKNRFLFHLSISPNRSTPLHRILVPRNDSKNSHAEYNTFWHVLRIIGFCLSFGNSCANPIALYFVSAAFRKHFNR